MLNFGLNHHFSKVNTQGEWDCGHVSKEGPGFALWLTASRNEHPSGHSPCDQVTAVLEERTRMDWIATGGTHAACPPFPLLAAAAAAKSRQSCPTLCKPIDSSPPGSSVPEILQTRTLEWVAISFSNAWKWKVKVNSLSRVWHLATPWTAAYQAPPVGFSR